SLVRNFFSQLFYTVLRPPSTPLFPYTTLFRSGARRRGSGVVLHRPAASGDRGADELEGDGDGACRRPWPRRPRVARRGRRLPRRDRKSTRLNSSHVSISYAVFGLKKKTHNHVD